MNKVLAIMHLFPQANPLKDFIVQDDSDDNGAYIAQWNLEDQQPTEEELQAAWDYLQSIPAPEPEKTLDEKVSLIDDRTVGMQGIDEYTLGMTVTLEERTQGLQDIDDYALNLIFEQAALIESQRTSLEALTLRVATLEGGNA